MHVPEPSGLWLAASLVVLSILAGEDLLSRRLPNAWTALLFCAGLTHAATYAGTEGALAAFAGAGVGAGALLWQYSRGWMGAGDVKLLGAIGAWTGPLGALFVLLIGSLLGGIMAFVLLARGRERGGTKVPFGIALSLAGFAVIALGLGL